MQNLDRGLHPDYVMSHSELTLISSSFHIQRVDISGVNFVENLMKVDILGIDILRPTHLQQLVSLAES